MTVNVVLRVALRIAVHGDRVVGEQPDKAGLAEIGLAAPGLVVALLAADEAALITRSESRRDHKTCIAYPDLAVPVRRLAVVAGRARQIAANGEHVVDPLARDVLDLRPVDAVAGARVNHRAVR